MLVDQRTVIINYILPATLRKEAPAAFPRIVHPRKRRRGANGRHPGECDGSRRHVIHHFLQLSHSLGHVTRKCF